MKSRCRSCGREYEVEPTIADGQEVFCPFCDTVAVYRKPTRIEIPADARRARQNADGQISIGRGGDTASTGESEMTIGSSPTMQTKGQDGMQPVSRFHVIRPERGPSSSRKSADGNAMVDRVTARAQAEARRQRMKRIRIVAKDLFLIFVLYAIAVVLACLFLPRRIADADARNFGVRVAVAKTECDLRTVRGRIGAVTASVRERNLSKITEAAMILDDMELNRLARVYLGNDWTGRVDAFLERVVRSRGRLFLQKERDEDERKAKDGKIRDLEMRKSMLSHFLRSPHRDRDRDSRRQEVERQLVELCETGDLAASDGKKEREDPHAAAWAKNEDELVALAVSEEETSGGALVKDISEKLEWLRWKADEPARLRRVASFLCVGPFIRIVGNPTESGHEE